jgi:outer membrane lipase/esterase
VAPGFSYGLVAGIILQRIGVNGFSESDMFAADPSGGFTALTYGSQVRDSAVTELGVQAGIDVGLCTLTPSLYGITN